MATVLFEQQEFAVTPIAEGSGLWLAPADVERITGFTLKPEGLCKDAICVPVPRGDKDFVENGAVDVAAFWRHLGHPVASEGDVFALGIGAGARSATLEALEAPDFSLPDLDGRMHALSEHRGKKVFLATWASW